jgi:hypothetical protein
MVRDKTFSIFSGVVLPAACSAHPCQHVEASNLEDNPSITLLPMQYVLILNRGD